MSIKTEKFIVSGMVCSNCEKIIDKNLSKLNGVVSCKSNYQTSSLIIKYDSSILSIRDISNELNEIGYSLSNSRATSKKASVENNKVSELISIAGIIAIALVIISLGKNSGSFDMTQALSSKISFLALFVVGILTSLHCVGMCGGIMMSQSITIDNIQTKNKFKPAFLYNLGRLISYTVLGGVVGGIGQVFSLSLRSQAAIALFAGLFMVMMGFNMYGFKIFRKFSIKLPWSNCNTKNTQGRPFIVGLANGLMPCGPLQTMQLYALASGSVLLGATSMFFFALGTIPLMLGFGMVANLLSKNNSKKIIKLSGIIVVVLGISMATRGLSLLGITPSIVNNGLASNAPSEINKATITDGIQTVRITANQSGYSPNTVYIQKGIPTQFIIEGEQITSCNNAIVIPSLNIGKELTSGENIIEIPEAYSDISYSCWMGMLRGNIKVVDDLSSVTSSDEVVPQPSPVLFPSCH